MGYWGMGLAQSDEFCEIYGQFMEKYDQGEPVAGISKDILAQYHKEFDDKDDIMHDVYFALAKAEWMCCEQSKDILKRVGEIIASQANIQFYKELGATASELKIRQKKLEAFNAALQIPRAKPRKRYPYSLDVEKPFPPMEIGDCFAYKYDQGKRVVIILDWVKNPELRKMVFCCILKNTYSLAQAKVTDFLEEDVGCIACFVAEDFLGKSNLKKVGAVSIPPNIKNEKLGKIIPLGSKNNFKWDYSDTESCSLRDFLENKNFKLHGFTDIGWFGIG